MSAALEAAEVLASHAPAMFAPVKVDGPLVYLETPDASRLAADWLREWGMTANAERTAYGWAIRIEDQ